MMEITFDTPPLFATYIAVPANARPRGKEPTVMVFTTVDVVVSIIETELDP